MTVTTLSNGKRVYKFQPARKPRGDVDPAKAKRPEINDPQLIKMVLELQEFYKKKHGKEYTFTAVCQLAIIELHNNNLGAQQ